MDKATKILLAVIAAGLWVNIAASLNVRATAQTPPLLPPLPRPQLPMHDTDLSDIQRELLEIEHTLSSMQLGLLGLEEGYCRNRRLCGP